MFQFEYLKNVATLELDPDKCDGCGVCVKVCPHRVFEMRDKRSSIANLDACMECGACQNNCEPGALKVDSGVGCAAAVLNGVFGNDKVCC